METLEVVQEAVPPSPAFVRGFFYGWSLGIDMKPSMTGDVVSGAFLA